MSEYQYYEFQAIDRELTGKEMAALRKLSTRAEITPTSFTNEYQWGDFKGKPDQMMVKYFDAFLYYANWGTRWVMLRFPRDAADFNPWGVFLAGDALTVRVVPKFVILSFRTDFDPEDDIDPQRLLGQLAPLREDILQGDLRALYLVWLGGVQSGFVKGDRLEPPVPPGLKELSGRLGKLVDFLRIDLDLVEKAAEASSTLSKSGVSKRDLVQWVAKLPEKEKNAYLVRVMEGHGAKLQAELLRRSQQKLAPPKEASTVQARRPVRELSAILGDRE